MSDVPNRGEFSITGDIHGNVVNVGGSTESNSYVGPSVGTQTSGAATEQDAVRSRVFVVHGRDDQVRRAMFEFLRKLSLQPLEWEDIVQATGQSAPFLGQVMARGVELAQAAIVILTPDDGVTLLPALREPDGPAFENAPSGQPRPNVLIELGMLLMALPERTIIIEIGDLRPIADLAGRNVIRFDGSAVSVAKIVARLKAAGCQVNDHGAEWRDTRPFADLNAYYRRP